MKIIIENTRINRSKCDICDYLILKFVSYESLCLKNLYIYIYNFFLSLKSQPPPKKKEKTVDILQPRGSGWSQQKKKNDFRASRKTPWEVWARVTWIWWHGIAMFLGGQRMETVGFFHVFLSAPKFLKELKGFVALRSNDQQTPTFTWVDCTEATGATGIVATWGRCQVTKPPPTFKDG